MNAGTCITTGCQRKAARDGESGGYFWDCDRCSAATHSSAGVHAHQHSCGPRSWVTATTLRPVATADRVTGWECRESLPNGRGICGYTTTSLTGRRVDVR